LYCSGDADRKRLGLRFCDKVGTTTLCDNKDVGVFGSDVAERLHHDSDALDEWSNEQPYVILQWKNNVMWYIYSFYWPAGFRKVPASPTITHCHHNVTSHQIMSRVSHTARFKDAPRRLWGWVDLSADQLSALHYA